jgi:NAD-dependent deacetylase
MRAPIASALPNAAHRALARFEASLRERQSFLLVTQNVDGLHQRAGSKKVVELHGNIGSSRCADPECELKPFPDEESHAGGVPRCPVCSGILRPDVVLFGEAIPPFASWQAKRALRECDLFISVGTSGVVFPAADFVRSAQYAGARTIYVNLEPITPPNPAFEEIHLGKAEELLPRLLGIGA